MGKVIMNSLPAELTPKEIAELELAEQKPPVFDDDCPEMTDAMLKQFQRMDKITVWLSSSNMEKVRSLGPDYTKTLSHLLDLAINDSELMKKCI